MLTTMQGKDTRASLKTSIYHFENVASGREGTGTAERARNEAVAQKLQDVLTSLEGEVIGQLSVPLPEGVCATKLTMITTLGTRYRQAIGTVKGGMGGGREIGGPEETSGQTLHAPHLDIFVN
jgi:hypothetical protein